MTTWNRNFVFGLISVQLRMIKAVILKTTRSPSRILALMLLLILFLALWSDFLIDKREKYRVNSFKYDKSVFSKDYFRPIKKDLAFWESKDAKASECPIYKFRTNNSHLVPNNDTVSVTCKRLLPIPGSCEIAKDIFNLHGPPDPASCHSQKRFDFCRLQHAESTNWSVLCDLNATRVCSSGLRLGLPSHETGELIWEEYQSASAVEKQLMDLIRGIGSSHNPPHYGFVFIDCDRKQNENGSYYYHEYQDPEDTFASQLLLLPPFIKSSSELKNYIPSSFHDLNLNLIFVDSVSHQHMFRSLPKTISMLEKIASNSVANVFNFELFQAIKSRTFETLQTMFSGYVNDTEKPFETYGIPEMPLNLSPIFKRFQSRKFRTLWLEDLCYLWEWGISKDLKFLKLDSLPEDTWKRMWLALKENGIDSVDTTIAMCRVLEANGVKDHFHGPDAVCFNGRHQHEYLLEYLKLYQTEMTARKQPFFTMASTNVAHEQSGKRVQTLDDALADYMSYTSSLENTISIVFSDHGNSYGNFFKQSKEAMTELYHPFLFIIIPHSAAALLGRKNMDSLRINTKRLISHLDVHYTLLHIVALDNSLSNQTNQKYPVSEKGLFEPVDPQRDCYSVPRLKPNICICQSASIQLDSTSFGSLFGYFAVGVLNDEIQYLYRQWSEVSTQNKAFGNCEPLHLQSITDIKELAGPDGQRIFQMNIHVQQAQIFFVSVTLKRSKDGESNTFIDSYSKITPYGIYSNCNDLSTELALCICDLSMNTGPKQESRQKARTGRHSNALFSNVNQSLELNFNYALTYFEDVSCFGIRTASHRYGVTIFGVNDCENTYSVKMNIKGKNIYLYFLNKEDIMVRPGGIALLALFVSEHKEFELDVNQAYFTLRKL